MQPGGPVLEHGMRRPCPGGRARWPPLKGDAVARGSFGHGPMCPVWPSWLWRGGGTCVGGCGRPLRA
nr:MAG TPA: hypothetical protein [Caudoviricetes sp.]